MRVLLTISWRNIWRNPKRSIVMIIAVTIGLLGGIFSAGLMSGLVKQRFATSIEQHISHLQIHNPEFLKDNNLENNISDITFLNQRLNLDPNIKAYSARSVANGMLATANLTSGVNILGIDPEMEAQTTSLNRNIIEGTYFDDGSRNPILVGSKLAEKNKIQERSRLVLTFQDHNGELVSASFRVAGIYQTSNSLFDERHVYIRKSDMANIINEYNVVNEVAIVAFELDSINTIGDKYLAEFPNLSVRTWSELSPELSYLHEMSEVMLLFILGIILLALAFGLVNTMLMSVFERIQELGMLMAIGMSKKRVFSMILLETTFLTFLGAIGGMTFGFILIKVLSISGLDLAAVGGDSLNEFGFPSMVYPQLEPKFFINLTILVFITAMITTIFPALKAIRLRPAEAVKIE